MNKEELEKLGQLIDEMDFQIGIGSAGIYLEIEKVVFLKGMIAKFQERPPVEFSAKLTKLSPKETKDGDVIDLTVSTLFSAEFLKTAGQFFGRYVKVFLEEIPAEERVTVPEAKESKELDEDIKNQIPLFDKDLEPGTDE